MKKYQIIILIIVILFTFLITYLPHFVNPYPMHIDEWHHITQALKLKNQESPAYLELGFAYILMTLSYIIDLVLYYKFFPAIWTITSALTLFFVVYQKTNKNFFIAIFSMLFFISIKSNVNLAGIWFLTPLTFSIPFIFLYIYFFTEGIEKQNKKYILLSLAIMLFLIPIHSISVLFSIYFLLIYMMFNYKYLIKEYKFFLSFLLIPIAGILFFAKITNQKIIPAILQILNDLQFKHGWGVSELNNSPLEVYSLIGYILALFALIMLLFFLKQQREKYLPYILWPIMVLIPIIIFKLTDFSYLVPYQRNMYYFVISLPFLSALGLFYLIKTINTQIQNKTIRKIVFIIILIFIIIATFKSYIYLDPEIRLYKVIDKEDYEALKFLSQYPQTKIMADPATSTAAYAISGHYIVADTYFNSYYENDTEKFYSNSTTCKEQQEILNKHKVSYVYFKNQSKARCNWTLIYDKERYIYEV